MLVHFAALLTPPSPQPDVEHPSCSLRCNRRPFPSFCMASSPSRQSSDIDFADVFGGPPRRSAVFERGRSRADSLDLSSLFSSRSGGTGGRGREHRPSGLGIERPVFGEVSTSPGRRRNLANDFFSDIFPGNDSECSTPRKVDGDMFSSTPGSRVLSPNRPASLGDSSLPARFSFPVKTTKGEDNLTFSPPMHRFPYKIAGDASDVTMFSSSPNASPHKNRVGNVGHAFHNQSPLAGEFSHVIDNSLEISSIESQSQKDTNSLQSYIISNKFHFSIYRWAGKGVLLSFPFSKEGIGHVSRLGRLAEVVIQTVDLPSDDDNVSTATRGNLSENQDNNSQNAISDSNDAAGSAFTNDVMVDDSESKSLKRSFTEKAGRINNGSEEVPSEVPDMRRDELRSLHQMFNDDREQIGHGESIRQAEKAEGFMGVSREVDDIEDKKKAQEEERKVDNAVKFGMQEDQTTLEDKMRGSKVKGKVKEFLKIFSPESPPKRKATFETGNRKLKGKDRVKSKVVDMDISVAKVNEELKTSSASKVDVGVPMAKAYEQLKNSSANKVEDIGASVANAYDQLKTSSAKKVEHVGDSIAKAYEQLKTSSANKGASDVTSPEVNETRKIATSDFYLSSHAKNQSHSKKDISSKPSSVQQQESINLSAPNIEESFKDPEECLVEPSSDDQNKPPQTVLQQDQIQIADSKIRDWSKGKECNIRSLLSTLQYVLWPESGWRPVPLVDIIEGSSVKRAYQRALLCLHPDKLQQRGADVHQKYIAQKVFDILQEAWEQFNSVSIL